MALTGFLLDVKKRERPYGRSLYYKVYSNYTPSDFLTASIFSRAAALASAKHFGQAISPFTSM